MERRCKGVRIDYLSTKVSSISHFPIALFGSLISCAVAMATIEALAFSPVLSDHHQHSLPSPSSSLRILSRAHKPPSLPSPFLTSLSRLLKPNFPSRSLQHFPASVVRSAIGENPEWFDDDYIVLGLAHVFRQDDEGKLQDVYLIEPVTSGSLECMDNGGVTCYHHVFGSTLGVAMKLDASLLPPEFSSAPFCSDYDYRLKCASRTWKRPHSVENLQKIIPVGSVRSDFNFSLTDKRIINKEHVVNDSDNIKQDMSIDVYGRDKEAVKDEAESQIQSLYNA